MVESKFNVKREISLLNGDALNLVQFSHANLKTSNKMKFELYKGDVSYQKQNRILVASTNRLQYSGANFEREMFKITSSVLKLAVLNKKTDRMKLYEVDYFLLKPILKCNFEANITERSFQEQNQDLTLQFGSKNKQKSVHSKLKFTSGGASIDESLLNRISQNEIATTEVPLPMKPPTESIIPPQDKNAKRVAEVYNIFDILSHEEYHALDSEINVFKDASPDIVQLWKSDAKYSDLIINYMECHFQSLTDDNAKLLCYLHYMMHFFKLKFKDLRKKDPVPEIPEPFKTKLMSRYLVNKTLPERMKDKLLADITVLYLHLNHFFVDGKIISSSTKISLKRIVGIAYALGCHVHSDKTGSVKQIELKLPLYNYVPFGRKK